MIRIWTAAVSALALAGCNSPEREVSSSTAQAAISSADKRSGYTFLTAETQALQDDDFANPGYLWVDKGAAHFAEGKAACASCHGANGEALKGAAVSYPKIDAASGQLINLEQRINICRDKHQEMPELLYESDDLLALTSYVANLSRGLPVSVETSGKASKHYENGKAYFFKRRGQLNLACSTCHDDHWGGKLRGDTISQGHGNGFPAYRLEWQSLGSLHRRFQDCDTGVRAEPLVAGSQDYVDLELYLASRAEGLEIETPAVRR